MKKIFTIIIAGCLIFSCFALSAGAAAENVAEGAAYTTTAGFYDNEAYNDGPSDDIASKQRLTDGYKSTTAGTDTISETDKTYLAGAYKDTNVEIIVDLGQVYDSLTKFNVDHAYNSWGISDLGEVEYFVSEDNENYTSVGKVAKADAKYLVGSAADYDLKQEDGKKQDKWVIKDYTLDLEEAAKGRYVKIVATCTNYLWASEIQIFNGEGAPAETSSQAPAETSSTSSSTTHTGDSGIIAVAVIAMIALAGAVVVKKTR